MLKQKISAIQKKIAQKLTDLEYSMLWLLSSMLLLWLLLLVKRVTVSMA